VQVQNSLEFLLHKCEPIKICIDVHKSHGCMKFSALANFLGKNFHS